VSDYGRPSSFGRPPSTMPSQHAVIGAGIFGLLIGLVLLVALAFALSAVLLWFGVGMAVWQSAVIIVVVRLILGLTR